MHVRASLWALVVCCSSVAWAQRELVDPEASASKPGPDEPAATGLRAVDSDVPEDFEEAQADARLRDLANRSAALSSGDAGVGSAKGAGSTVPAAEPKPVAKLPEILTPALADSNFASAWADWRSAAKSKDVAREKRARAELVRLKARAGADDVESLAVGVLRAADGALSAGDNGAAVEMALTATELAPHVPAVWVGLAHMYLQADPTEVPRIFRAVRQALALGFDDPRYARPLLLNWVAVLILSLVLLSLAVVGVLFAKCARMCFYDFHLFFPRVAARWQTAALASLLLALPLAFRLGLAAFLLALFAASTLYLSVTERSVAAVLIALLGLVPWVGAQAVESAAFAETAAEDMYRLEQGGAGLDQLAARYEALAQEDKVNFSERAVLGRFFLRRGQLEAAVGQLRQALNVRPDDVGARVNLGVALFLSGDLENSRALLESVEEARHPVALFNLGRLYKRRLAAYGEAVASEVDRANQVLALARELDPSLPPSASDDPKEAVSANEFLRTVPLARADLLALAKNPLAAERVQSQLTQILLGPVPMDLALMLPMLAALLLVGFGTLSGLLGAARPCTRCGQGVSRRDDRELPLGGRLCTQCVNVFTKKDTVAPALKMRKQLEIARHASMAEKVSVGLGAVWSGMGHVFIGRALQGTVYGFFFIFGVVALILHQGVMRAPFQALPSALWGVPTALAVLLLSGSSWRGLRRSRSS